MSKKTKSNLCVDILTYENVKLMSALSNHSKAYDAAVQNFDMVDEYEELYSTHVPIKTLDDVYNVMNLLKDVKCHLQLRYNYTSEKLSFDLAINQSPLNHWRGGEVIREVVSIHEHNINADLKSRINEAVKILKN